MKTVSAPAVAIMEDGIDTDVIFPARFLLYMEKEGLGEYLFADRKPKGENCSHQSFSLERPDHRPVQILLAGAQFGCGSSREHAVWSLIDFGIRVVIAPSFGEIFANNAPRNGLAAICLDQQQVDLLAKEVVQSDLTVDLISKTITTAGGNSFDFDIAEGDRQALINGWDEIDIIQAANYDDIERFEAAYSKRRPWLFKDIEGA